MESLGQAETQGRLAVQVHQVLTVARASLDNAEIRELQEHRAIQVQQASLVLLERAAQGETPVSREAQDSQVLLVLQDLLGP